MRYGSAIESIIDLEIRLLSLVRIPAIRDPALALCFTAVPMGTCLGRIFRDSLVVIEICG